jgi:hypothetical protein
MRTLWERGGAGGRAGRRAHYRDHPPDIRPRNRTVCRIGADMAAIRGVQKLLRDPRHDQMPISCRIVRSDMIEETPTRVATCREPDGPRNRAIRLFGGRERPGQFVSGRASGQLQIAHAGADHNQTEHEGGGAEDEPPIQDPKHCRRADGHAVSLRASVAVVSCSARRHRLVLPPWRWRTATRTKSAPPSGSRSTQATSRAHPRGSTVR